MAFDPAPVLYWAKRTLDIQSMALTDAEYNGLRRRKLLRGLYSMPDEQDGGRLRFFMLNEAALTYVPWHLESAPTTVPAAVERIALKLRTPDLTAPSQSASHGGLDTDV